MNKATRLAVVATAVAMAWVIAGTASAKPEFAKATGKKCSDCHSGAPSKANLTDAGKEYQKTLKK